MTDLAKPTVAVVIASHNRVGKTLACLAALAAQTADIELITICVDDGSADATGARVQAAFPSTIMLYGDGNLYWGGATRLGSEEAHRRRARYILWLNDDVILTPDALQVLLDTLEEWPREAIACGAVHDAESGRLTYGGVRPAGRWLPLRLKLVEPELAPVPVSSMNGNVVLIPADLDLVLGGLDPLLPHGLGDWDYGLRATQCGYEVVLAPGYVGTCSRGEQRGTYGDFSLDLPTRLRLLRSVKGLPPKAWRRYVRRHGGHAWLLHWVAPYAYLLRTHYGRRVLPEEVAGGSNAHLTRRFDASE